MLDPSCLVPPSIPNTLGAEDIDKVIAALTNVPDVSLPDGFLDSRRSRSQERRRRHSSGGPIQARDGDRAENYGGEDEYAKMRRGGMTITSSTQFTGIRMPAADYNNDGGRAFIGGRRGGRGGLSDIGNRRDRDNRVPDKFKGGWANGPRGGVAGAKGPVARGRNIFPAEEKRGRGRRVNNLFKRFQAQHRDKLGEPEGDLLYDGFGGIGRDRGRRDERSSQRRSRSRSRGRRSRKRSASSSSDSSSSSSSGEDHKKKKKKVKKEKKEKKDKKRKKDKKKKKKRSTSSSESEEEKKEEGLDWRVDLLKKMKDIKNLPPEELEAEFKKAMGEKKRKEDEEKCLQSLKEKQKIARKVKKESEKAAKRMAKQKAKEAEEKGEEAENEEEPYGDNGVGNFYNGFTDALGRMQALQENFEIPEEPKNIPFMSSFAEVPFVPEGGEVEGEGGEGEGLNVMEQELDPYMKAHKENLERQRREQSGEDVSWPSGAIENMGEGEEQEMTKEQMDAEQEAMELEAAENMDDKTKEVVNTSKMFSKIKNNLKSKASMKIHLKTKRMEDDQDEGVGLEPYQGDATPGEVVSGEEQEQFGDYDEFDEQQKIGGLDDEYDLRQEPGARSSRQSRERDPDEVSLLLIQEYFLKLSILAFPRKRRGV